MHGLFVSTGKEKMAGHIPRSFIDELLNRHDIVDIIDARVKLKKQGKNYGACCPFHNEKSPSFSVSQEKQFYHCFGCGVHGNAIDFLMEFDRLEFVEAIEELASMLGLDVPREQRSGFNAPSSGPTANSEQKRSLYNLMGSISQFYRSQLKSAENIDAINYLKGRGLTGEIVQKFGIGYIADEWDLVKNNFARDKASQDALVSGGMLIESDNGHCYDRFRGRVMFPIRDRRGRVIGFGGRVIGEGTPKYLNSPETPIFHKGKELYGLYEALQAYKDLPQALVVEGYMDVVALAQYGVDYAVASLGTATTGDHMQLLFRQTSTVVCCYDGDRAGRKAARGALENALAYLNGNKTLKVMFLPEGEDPDSYVRKYGKNQLEVEMAQALSLPDFLLRDILERVVDSSSREGKRHVVTLAAPLLNQVKDPSLKTYLWDELSLKVGWSHDQIDRFLYELNKSASKNNQQQNEPKRFVQPEIKRTAMREVITLLLQNPELAQLVPDLESVKEIPLPGLSLFLQLLESCRHNPHITTGLLLEHWRGDKNEKLLSRLAAWELPIDQDNIQDVFMDSLDSVLAQCINQQIESLQTKERTLGLSVEEKRELLALMLELKA